MSPMAGVPPPGMRPPFAVGRPPPSFFIGGGGPPGVRPFGTPMMGASPGGPMQPQMSPAEKLKKVLFVAGKQILCFVFN